MLLNVGWSMTRTVRTDSFDGQLSSAGHAYDQLELLASSGQATQCPHLAVLALPFSAWYGGMRGDSAHATAVVVAALLVFAFCRAGLADNALQPEMTTSKIVATKVGATCTSSRR